MDRCISRVSITRAMRKRRDGNAGKDAFSRRPNMTIHYDEASPDPEPQRAGRLMSDSAHEPHAPADRGPIFLERLRRARHQRRRLRDDIEDALDQSGPGDEFSTHERHSSKCPGLHEHRVKRHHGAEGRILSYRRRCKASATSSRSFPHGRTFKIARPRRYARRPKGAWSIRDFVDRLALPKRIPNAAVAPARGCIPSAAERWDPAPCFARRDRSSRSSGSYRHHPSGAVRAAVRTGARFAGENAGVAHARSSRDRRYGGTDGLVSVNVVEMIVGTSRTNTTSMRGSCHQRLLSDREFLIDARALISWLFLARPGWTSLDPPDRGCRGRSPGSSRPSPVASQHAEEVIRYGPLPDQFEVVDADPRQVNQVRLRLRGRSLFPEAGDARARDQTRPDLNRATPIVRNGSFRRCRRRNAAHPDPAAAGLAGALALSANRVCSGACHPDVSSGVC